MYYGWLIVGVAMYSAFLGAGLNNVTMSVILKPLSDDQGWTRTLTSGAITAGALLAGFLSPGVGRAADRIGPRLLMPVGAAAVGTLVILLSRIDEPWQFYATYVPARALGDTLLCGVVPLTAVANWFQAKRPRVIGLVLMAVPLGSAVMAFLYQMLIVHWGWRTAFVALGVLLWALAVVPPALLLRRQPEDLGLLPDGAAPRGPTPDRVPRQAEKPADEEQSWRLAEAIRTPTLWLIVASSTLATVATGGIAFHLVAYYTDVHIRPDLAAGALSVFALSGAFGSTLWGLLAERIPPRRVGMAVLLGSAAVVVLLLQVRVPLLAFVVALLIGLLARGGLMLTQVLLARYYGRRSFGAISGFADPFGKAGLGLGPLCAAAVFDLTGSYQGVFVAFGGAYAIAAGLVFFARAPARKDLEVGQGPALGSKGC
jgi:sugar phosphate permease